MFLVAFGVQEMAVGRIQVAKRCQDKFSRILFFGSLGFIREYLYITKISMYTGIPI